LGDPGDGNAVLSIRELRVEFETDGGPLRAVDGVSFDLLPGQTLGVVGESGSGKTVTALSILGLLDSPSARLRTGEILYQGRDLLRLPEPELRALRGNRIAMVFQDPMTSLNPVYPVGEQIAEAVRAHAPRQRGLRKQARARAIELLGRVGIPAPEERARSYPHQLSGGMRQRVMIAMALACRPDVLIADEPTTALDVTVQAQILALLSQLRRELKMSMLLITHDLGVVAETCDRVVVLYAGQVIESAATRELFAGPRHPYTAGLLRSLPRPGADRSRLVEIPGMVPDLRAPPTGCRFADRCPRAKERCRAEAPPLFAEADRSVRCFFPETP
jgi:oligopeptide/dipeptide ABC transporter ATP-binding protein